MPGRPLCRSGSRTRRLRSASSQGGQPLSFGEIRYQAEPLKGGILLEHGASDQEGKGGRAESIELQADEFTHAWGEEARHAKLLDHRCRDVTGPCAVFTQGEMAAFKQQLERFDQIERLPACFGEEPLPNTFQGIG